MTTPEHQAALVRKTALEAAVKRTSKRMQDFATFRKSSGLLPDHVRESTEYKLAKSEYDLSFQVLREFNKRYVKQFANEIRK